MRLVRVQVAPLPRRRAFRLDIAPNRPPAVLDGTLTLAESNARTYNLDCLAGAPLVSLPDALTT